MADDDSIKCINSELSTKYSGLRHRHYSSTKFIPPTLRLNLNNIILNKVHAKSYITVSNGSVGI